MLFAVLDLSDDPMDAISNRFVKALPGFIKKRYRNTYIKKYIPFKAIEFELDGVKGIKVLLPFTKDDLENNRVLFEEITEKILLQLKEREVVIAVPPVGIVLPPVLPSAQGKWISALKIHAIVKKTLKIMGKEIGESEVLIIDGDDFLTDTVICNLYPYINHLSIYTDKKEDFDVLVEELYAEAGLNVQVFTNNKNNILKEADVIINCGNDMENYDYYFKKGAIYVDVNKNRLKLKRLMGKRRDMFFTDSPGLKYGASYLTAELFEALYYVESEKFRLFVQERLSQMAEAVIEEESLSISSFYALHSPVNQREIERIVKINQIQ